MIQAKKVIKLSPMIEKNLRRARGHQSRRGSCIICSRDWADCPHNRVQTDALEHAYRIKQVIG